MAFEVPASPYDYGALEPHIDEQTMRLHHDKHHQAYVDNVNKALEGTDSADKPVEHVLTNLDVAPRGQAGARCGTTRGGHANHSLFWEIMGPDGGGEPTRRARAMRSTTSGAASTTSSRRSTTPA